MDQTASIWMWIGFGLFILLALAADTYFLGGKNAHTRESMRRAFFWVAVWVSCAIVFNILLWLYLYISADIVIANKKALEFFTGYLIEESLSIDNLFVFYLIFSHFRIPRQYQHRVLAYGIWGAVIMRLIMILIGVWLITRFHWLIYVMGAFLFLTGIKICITREKEKDLSETMVLRLIKRCIRVTNTLHGHQFFHIEKNLLYATPLFVALIFVEVSDLIFALDSIPAIFAITTDPFIVWTSNIFAILGLRAMYFVLAGMVEKFQLLKYGIALILVFVGSKMLMEPWIHIPVALSLGIVISILILFTFISFHFARVKKHG